MTASLSRMLFGLSFPDRKLFKRSGSGFNLYTSASCPVCGLMVTQVLEIYPLSLLPTLLATVSRSQRVCLTCD